MENDELNASNVGNVSHFLDGLSNTSKNRVTLPIGSILPMDDDKARNSPDKNSPSKRRRVFQIDEGAHERYKNMLRKRFWAVVVLLSLIILERVFSSSDIDSENDEIIYLQRLFGVTPNSPFWLAAMSFLGFSQLFDILLVCHFYATIFYMKSPILCIKILVVHINLVAIVPLFQLAYESPRPYWVNPDIVGIECPSSFAYPNSTVFTLLFLILYAGHCWNNYDRIGEEKKIIFRIIFAIVLVIISLVEILAGFQYFYQLVLSLSYVFVFYFVALSFDKTINHIVEKSTIDVLQAKRYTIFWLLHVIIFAGFATMLYLQSDKYINIEWVQNFYICLAKNGESRIPKDTPDFHVIGPWGSYMISTAIFILLGAVFGTAKTFRDYKGMLWFNESLGNRIKMAIVANLCLSVSWVLAYFLYVSNELIISGINTYLIDFIHYSVIFYVIFGVLPRYVFGKLGWINQKSSFRGLSLSSRP